MSDHDVIADFESAMRAAKLTPVLPRGEKIRIGQGAEGRPNRFHVQGDHAGTRNGWYVLFADGVPAGEFGSWRTGEVHRWCAKDRRALTPEENDAVNAKIEAAREERKCAQKQREGYAAKLANLMWLDAAPVYRDDHPYLKRKGIVSHGLRRCAWPIHGRDGGVLRHIENCLLIPVLNKSGKIVSLQAIFPDVDEGLGRDKSFMSGGQKRGCFYMIGSPPEDGGIVAFSEGYATACTVHAATDACVIVAWDAYNLPPVVESVREMMPRASFLIAADNDQFTHAPVENPGVAYAQRAAAGSGARVVVPSFANTEGEPTDFNDLAAREGIDVVRAQLMPQTVVATAGQPERIAARYTSPIAIMSIDTASPFDDIDGKGRPLPTVASLAEMLRRIGAIVRYNIISKDSEILIPGLASTLDNQAEASRSELVGWCYRFRMSTANFDGNLVAYADQNPYNPVATWIESKPWDGVSRLSDFFATIVAVNDPALEDGSSFKDMLLLRWMLSAAAALYEKDGVVARGVLTFTGKQHIGKTHWVKRLAPKELDAIADGMTLDPSNKDSVKLCVSKWIVELGEVDATFRKSDIAALKAFISKDRDELRRPYAHTESKYARRTVFCASVNGANYLKDTSGNSRWWTIHASSFDNSHSIDMQQTWAEIAALYRAGESWHLSREELGVLNAVNSGHESLSPVHEMIDKMFDWDAAQDWWKRPMRATEIARAIGIDKPNKNEINEAANYVTQRYGVEKAKHGKQRTTVWMMPPLAAMDYPL